ncbi:hypothetical protein D3C71_2233750 [compost metagenome]
MTFQGKQRIAAGAAVIAVQADAVHERVGGIAEDEQVIGIAQVPVVVDPVRQDWGLVGDECRHVGVPP